MSGHSKWATIKRSKGKTDAARGKLFGRLIREITIATKIGGPEVESNPRLRAAVSSAKGNNMPKKNIENAIAKGAGDTSGSNYEDITFETYAPGGVAVVIETLTDNRNRTVAEVRHAVTRAGGNLGGPNSVKWMFIRKGLIVVLKTVIDEDKLMEIALDAGAEDIADGGDVFEISTASDIFEDVRSALESKGIPMESAEISMVPENTVKVTGDDAIKVLKLMSALDDLDDTQNVYGNFDISEEDMARYEG